MDTVEERIATVIRLGRERAWKELDEIMEQTYLDLAALIGGEARRTGSGLKFRGSLEGFSALSLNEISENAGNPDRLVEIIRDKNLHYRRSDFTGFRRMSMDNVKKKYPNAFTPWTEEDDSRLRKMYEEGWGVTDISSVLLRNPHAISLRLDHIMKR